jgi:hypothetical protein
MRHLLAGRWTTDRDLGRQRFKQRHRFSVLGAACPASDVGDEAELDALGAAAQRLFDEHND